MFIDESDHFRFVALQEVIVQRPIVSVLLVGISAMPNKPQEQIAISELSNLEK